MKPTVQIVKDPAAYALRRCLDVLLRLYPDVAWACGALQTKETEVDAAIVTAAAVLHGCDITKWPAPMLTAWLNSPGPIGARSDDHIVNRRVASAEAVMPQGPTTPVSRGCC